ncbi:hypothetical protein [Methylomicrobium lacus]|uniref:hypothetical protein n=1 Tax=Methylomicrobium lacus TaxID=136992 RepID=UPI00045EAF20|nr:hypothetical protein [Methylomicrobium lacus]
MHFIWSLPLDTDDFPVRWRLIKLLFSKGLPHTERLSSVRLQRAERGIWQSFRSLLTLLAYVLVGNAVIGNIPFLPNEIMLNMSIMFMSIGYAIGHIPLFTAMFATAFFRWIGAVM